MLDRSGLGQGFLCKHVFQQLPLKPILALAHSCYSLFSGVRNEQTWMRVWRVNSAMLFTTCNAMREEAGRIQNAFHTGWHVLLQLIIDPGNSTGRSVAPEV